jgi:hypothetical protein
MAAYGELEIPDSQQQSPIFPLTAYFDFLRSIQRDRIISRLQRISGFARRGENPVPEESRSGKRKGRVTAYKGKNHGVSVESDT